MATPKAQFPTKAVSLTKHPASLPEANIPDDVDCATIAANTLRFLTDPNEGHLTQNAIWRDSLALTGTLRTFFGPSLVTKVWKKLINKHRPKSFALVPDSAHVMHLGSNTSWIDARFTFDVTGPLQARCSGIIGIVPDGDSSSNGNWRVWLLSTILEQVEGFPDVDDLRPRSWDDLNLQNAIANGIVKETKEPLDCLVVGAGIAGLCMAGRLEALGLSYRLVEKHVSVGDNWVIDRYESLKLHTSKGYNQLPGEPRSFRPEDPYNLSTFDVADGFQRYVKMFGIKLMTSTTLVKGSYDDKQKIWVLQLHNKGADITLRARHVILATGSMGVAPITPQYKHPERFKGDVVHGLNWRSAEKWEGKTGIVIGSANTAHGVIADMARGKFKAITMFQRGKTFLLPQSTFGALVDPVYNEKTPVPVSDRMLLGYPLPIQRLMAMAGIKMCAEQNPTYFDRIESGGFNAERNGDLWGMMYDREGGHFFDLGAGELIANGTVKVRSDGVLPVEYTETGLRLSDGSEVEADVIVFATGYSGNIRETARRIFGDEIGDSLEEFWQCDEEGESRGAWKYTGHPALWYTGHGYAHARYYSRFVAMHINAALEGHPIEMYTDTPQI